MADHPTAPPSRREFLATLAAAAAWGSLPRGLAAAESGPFSLRLGYHAITWGGEDEKAIDEIAALGFKGIQLRSNVIPAYGEKPKELRRRLDEKGLALLCFSSGGVNVSADQRAKLVETHVSHARFVAALGGSFMQVTSERPKDRAPTPAEYETLGRLLNEIGKGAQDLGVRLVYHNHMGGFGESADEVARLLAATDPRLVGLLLDIAHWTQGGGDPVAAVSRHKDRIALLHLKDVRDTPPADGRPARDSYQFVELGRGRVNVKGVITALREIAFRGNAILELDAVPDPGRTPRECAETNRKYAVETLGLSL